MRVLVIAPHPDDETLGCGGTLLKHRESGDQIIWLIMTRGHEPEWTAETLSSKQAEIEKVTAAYRFEQVFRPGFPTVQMDRLALEDVIRKIRDVIDEARPDFVYLNHAGDVHSDHRVTFEATMSALKPFYSAKHGVRRVLSYETLSSTDAMPPGMARAFVPTVFTEITSFIERKLEIMSLYQTEIQAYPLPRALESIRALARLRGSTIGVEYAESFMLIREVS